MFNFVDTSPFEKMFDLMGEGDTFKGQDSKYYVKICEVARMQNFSPQGTYNALCLNTGKLAFIKPDRMVIPVDLKVSVEGGYSVV